MVAQFMASELASELYVDELLAGDGRILQVDNLLSMSALAEAEARASAGNLHLDRLSEGDPHGS